MPSARTAILALLLSVPVLAGSSTDYSLESAVLDGGGVAGSSADYALNPCIGPGTAGASAGYTLRGGFSGQLLDLVGIEISESSAAPTLNERAFRQLDVSEVYDDASRSTLAADRVVWSVQSSALLPINSNGLATAGSVYQDTAAAITAGYLNFSDTFSLVVLNLGTDDFGSYASDGLEDAWQVRYFGVGSAQAAAGTNPDGDTLTNLQEFAFGTDPSQSSGGSVQWTGSTLLGAGLPVPYASGTAGSFTFRAVYSRRKNFATAGLSYSVEFSGDLSTWKASTSTPSVLADDGEIQAVSVPYPFFVNGKKATYFRVKVQSQ